MENQDEDVWREYKERAAATLRCLEENTARYPSLLNQLTAKCCMVELKRRGASALVAAVPNNDLMPQQFVFKVLDHFANCGMKALADEVISYVGVNCRLPTELDRVRSEAKQTERRLVSEMTQLRGDISGLQDVICQQEASRKRDYGMLMDAVLLLLSGRQGAEEERGGSARKRKLG